METGEVKTESAEQTPVVSFDKVFSSSAEASVETPQTEQTEQVETVLKDEVVEKKYWDDEYKTHFGDEPLEQVKGYKTKAQELEDKIREYEEKLSENPYANENIAKLNELAKNGIEIDESTVAFLNKDYSKVTDNLEMVREFVKRENPDWSEKKINFEITKQFGLDKIKQNMDEDGELEALTEEQKELKEIIEEDLARAANNARAELQRKQDEIRLFKPEVKSPEEIRAEEQSRIEGERKWDEMVKEISSKNQSIKVNFSENTNVVINGKQVQIPAVEYSMTKEDKAEAESMFKGLGTLSPEDAPFLQRFADKNGNLNNDESRAKIFAFCQEAVVNQKLKEHIAVSAYKLAYENIIKSDKKVSDSATNPSPSGKVSLGTVPFDKLFKQK